MIEHKYMSYKGYNDDSAGESIVSEGAPRGLKYEGFCSSVLSMGLAVSDVKTVYYFTILPLVNKHFCFFKAVMWDSPLPAHERKCVYTKHW